MQFPIWIHLKYLLGFLNFLNLAEFVDGDAFYLQLWTLRTVLLCVYMGCGCLDSNHAMITMQRTCPGCRKIQFYRGKYSSELVNANEGHNCSFLKLDLTRGISHMFGIRTLRS